jgi:biotin synthase
MTPDNNNIVLPVNSHNRQDFLLQWLGEERADTLDKLWRSAQKTRERFIGQVTTVWGAVKISNHCDDDCGFCGLHADNKALFRFRLTTKHVLEASLAASATGCRQVVLQSGRDPGLATDWVSDLIRGIREETGLEVALSLGERSEEELTAWRRAGATSYFLRFLTSNTTLYRFLYGRQCEDPRHRIPLLATLRQMGYKVGSGIFVGFPGQSRASLTDDLELIRKLDLDVILAGPYIWPGELSQRHCRVQDSDPNSALAVLKVIALARLLCPSADIPSTSALATVSQPDIHAVAMRRGANVLMMDATPSWQRSDYCCYPGRVLLDKQGLSSGFGDQITLAGSHKQDTPPADGAAPAQDKSKLCVGVCMGSSCFSRGNNHTVALIKKFIAEQHLEGRVVLEGHLCQGQCKQGPNIMVDGEMQQQANPNAILGCLRQRLKIRE